MKRVATLLILFYLIQTISAQSINIDYPDKVKVGEEFFVGVELVDFSEGVYDVKIDVLGNGNRIAKILNGGAMKSTYYYINEAMKNGEKKEFQLVSEDYSGNAKIEVKIRKMGSSSAKTFGGYEIEVVKNQDIKVEEEKIEEEKIEEEIVDEADDAEIISGVKKNEESEENKLIQLSQNIKRVDGENEGSKKRIYAVYGFVLFSILILLLFVLKFITSKMPRGKNGIA